MPDSNTIIIKLTESYNKYNERFTILSIDTFIYVSVDFFKYIRIYISLFNVFLHLFFLFIILEYVLGKASVASAVLFH